MGYDMYLIGALTTEEQAVRDAARVAFSDAVKRRDSHPKRSEEAEAEQVAVERAYGEMIKVDKSYYRFNIWGMAKARAVMWELGMLKPGLSSDDWPQSPEGLPEEIEDLLSDEADEGMDRLDDPTFRAQNPSVTNEHVRLYRTRHEAIERHLVRHDGDTPGIGENKFSSNDGWVVTPFECHGAVAKWDAATPEQRAAALLPHVTDEWLPSEVEAWFTDWVNWLRFAQTREGFRVH